jgi:hypothetical protein
MIHRLIKRVSRFSAKGGDSQLKFRSVRWLPAEEIPQLGKSTGTWVGAYDGAVGIVCHAEIALPPALLPVDGLAQAVSSPIVAVDDQGQSVAMTSQSGGVFQVPKLDLTGYPLPPFGAPGLDWGIWSAVSRVLHCAAGPKSGRPTYEHVCLRPHAVEVTDSICVGVAPGRGWDSYVLVPARAFERLEASAKIQLSIDSQLVEIWSGGVEKRWGIARRDLTFPDCRGIVDSLRRDGDRLVVSTKALLEGVRQAVSISAASAVAVVFHGGSVGLLGWRGGGAATEHQYDVTLPALAGRGPKAPTAVYVDGRLLVRALRAVDTPSVLLGVSGEHEPLRLEWSDVSECIWPWRL